MGVNTCFLCVFLLLATSSAQNLICPSEVLNTADTYYLQTWKGWCLQFILTEEKTYREANTHCLLHNGTLALPKTEALNTFITDKLRDFYGHYANVWIGLHDKKVEGKFVWEDYTQLVWSNFAKGNGPGRRFFSSKYLEDCVSLDPKDAGRWHDYRCGSSVLDTVTLADSRKHFVCQYNAETAKQGDNKGQPGSVAVDTPKLGKVQQYPADDDGLVKGQGLKGSDPQDSYNNGFPLSDYPTDHPVPDDDCEVFSCGKDCGMEGFQIDENGCQICECN